MKSRMRALFCFRERMLAERTMSPQFVEYLLAVQWKYQR